MATLTIVLLLLSCPAVSDVDGVDVDAGGIKADVDGNFTGIDVYDICMGVDDTCIDGDEGDGDATSEASS
jgi:hypothetical protein